MLDGSVSSRSAALGRLRLATGVVALAIVGLLVGQMHEPAGSPTWSFPARSPAAGESAAPGETPAPGQTPAPDPWEALELAPYVPLADLTADTSDASGLATSAAFTLRSLTATPAVTLAEGLVADPAIEFDVTPGATPELVTLTPSAPLAVSTRYRFRLTAQDGSLAGTWSFRVGGPLHVVGLLPSDRSTGVPVSTGIEVTFDQDAPTGFEARFSITPAVDGRFERHDRTWVFVPTERLDPGTLYTYAVAAGVGMEGSGQTLETSATASFETAAPGGDEPHVYFDRPVFEVRTGTRPLLGIRAPQGNAKQERTADALTTLPIRLYRLTTFRAAVEAATTLQDSPEWLDWSSSGLVDTTGLARVGSFEARLTNRVDSAYVLHVPVVLDPGWYLLVVPRDTRDAQALIQVTDLATYALSSGTRTIVWLNDLETGTPVTGATVQLGNGPTIGQTDAAGLMDAPTPTELRDTAGLDWWEVGAKILGIRAPDGRSVVASLGMHSDGHYAYNSSWIWWDPQPWWAVFDTDRSQYRSTDTIHAWGYVQDRGDRHVPDSVELRLVPAGAGDEAGDDATPAIAALSVTPTARGAFVADIPIRDLPTGSYELLAYAGGDRIADRWLDVAVIRKPAYSIDVTSARHAYLAGDPIYATASAQFFDGTTVPGLDLNIAGWNGYDDESATPTGVTTDATGVAAATVTATVSGPERWTWFGVHAVPARPEEGEISGQADMIVFPSSAWLDASAAIRDGRFTLTGTVSKVDLAAVEQRLQQSGRPGNPAGAPLPRHELTVRIIHEVPVRHLVRTDYDYIEKRTIPIYEYSTRRVALGTWTIRSADDGSFSLAVSVPNTKDTYLAVVTTRDAKDRLSRATVYAWRPYPVFAPNGLRLRGPDEASVGQTVTLSVRRPGDATPPGRYLFIFGRDGIRDVVLSDDSSIQRTFGDADLPGYTVRAVRLSDAGLEVIDAGWGGDLTVRAKVEEQRLQVSLSPDRARYAPGERVTVAVRTTGPDGRPVAADVVVRATDQKLYAIDAAADMDPLWLLMQFVGSGFLQSYTAEFAPRPIPEGWGFGGGGGAAGRDDFRDSLTFQLVSTDAQGRGSVSFTLSDDLTSWHVAAAAFSADLRAGDGYVLVPVGLPFFVEAVIAPDYLTGEQPVLRLRAYGDGLRRGDPVRFVVSAPSLGVGPTTIDGRAFDAVRLPLPELPAGDHEIAIDGQRVGGAGLHDRLVRTIHVIPNRLTILKASYVELTGELAPSAGVGMATYLVTDAGRGSLIPILESLARGGGARFERLAAAEAARAILGATFDVPLDGLAPTGYDADRYQTHADGIAVLPYATADLALSAEAALVVPDQVDLARLSGYLHWLMADALDPDADPEDRPTPEQSIIAAAGLAALGEDVVDALRAAAAAEPNLSIRERLWLALGYLASGDEATAREIERDLLTSYGRRLGPWVRLSVPQPDEANALMLLLSAGLGDPVSTNLSRYLTDNPSRERPFDLEQLGYVRGMLDRLPRTSGSFAWTVDGQRHVETLEPGASFSVTLTPEQQRSLRFERLAGALLLTTTSVASATPTDLPSEPGLTITRTVSPAGGAADDSLVRVTITLSIGQRAGPGCYSVTDIVPSGLAPVASEIGWPSDDGSGPSRGYWPWLVDGQRVSWCVNPNDPTPLTYAARVVSPGRYTWEPAVVQYSIDPTIGAATGTTSYTIR